MFSPEDYRPFWRIDDDGIRYFDNDAFWASRSWLDRLGRDYRVRFWPIEDALRHRLHHLRQALGRDDCRDDC